MPFPSAEKKFVQEVRPRRRSIERDPDGTGYFDDDSSSESDSYFKKIKHISKKSTSSSQNKLKRNLTTKQFVDSYYNLTDIESSSNEDFKKKIREQTSNTPDKGTQTKLKESASAKSPEFTPTNPQILEDPENESQSRAPRFAMAVLSSTLSAVQTELRPQCNVVKSLCNLSLSFKRFVSRKQTSNVETRFGSKKADDSADDQNFGVAIVSKNPFKLSATVVKSLDKISETIRQILGSKKLSEQNIIEPQPQSKESEDNVIFKIPSYLSEDECEDQIHKIEETNEQTEKKDPKSSISLIMEDPFPIPSCSEWFREEFNEDVHETQFGFRKSDLRAPVLRSVTLNERPPRKHVNEQPQVKYLEEDEEKEEEAEDVQLPKSHFAVAMVVDDKQNVTTTDTTSAVEKSLEQLSKLKLSVQQQPEQPVQKLPVQQQPAQPTQVLKNIPSSTRVKRLSINKQRESSSPNTTLTSRKSHVSTPLSVSESTTIKDKSKPRSPEETTKDSPQLRIKRDKILPQTPKDSKKIPTSLRTNNQPEPTTATTPPTTSNTPPTTSNTPPTTSNNLPQNQTIPNNQIKPDHIFKLTDSARLAIPLLPSASSNTYIPYFQATTPPTSDTLPPTQQPLEITPETEALVSPDSTPPTNPPGCVSTSQQTHTDQNPTEDKNFSITVIVMEPGKSNDSWHAKGAIDRTLDKLVTSLQQLVNRRKSARTTGSGGSVTEPINNDVSSRTIPGQSNQTISEEPFSVAMIVMDQSSSPKKNTADASVCTSSCLNQMNKEPDKEL